MLKNIARQYRIEKNAYDWIQKHKSFFIEAIGKHLKLKNYMHNLVRNNEDPFFVNQFNDDNSII